LETVVLLLKGIARAKQMPVTVTDYPKCLPIIVHGDAAIAVKDWFMNLRANGRIWQGYENQSVPFIL